MNFQIGDKLNKHNYTLGALWCNSHNAFIEQIGGEYIIQAIPEPTAKEQAELDIKKLYDEMVKDVYDEMYKTFGTRNDVSAQAFAQTYDAMMKRPANYIGSSSRDGKILATEEEVLNYATEAINKIDAYGVYRTNRIAQFDREKAEILAKLQA